jgi:hypothetical protein
MARGRREENETLLRRISILLLALIVSGGVAVGTAKPASADQWSGCYSSFLCLYYYRNFNGGRWINSGSTPNYNLSWITFEGGSGNGRKVNDNSMSLKNGNWYWDVIACENSWWRGRCVRTEPGYNRADLGELNNRLSSHDWIS